MLSAKDWNKEYGHRDFDQEQKDAAKEYKERHARESAVASTKAIFGKRFKQSRDKHFT